MYPDLKSFFDDKDETVNAEELRATAEANEKELSRLEDVYESAGEQIQGLEEDLLPDLEANLELTASGPDQEEILRRYERFAQIAEQKPKQAQNLIRKEIEETAGAESKGPLEILHELRENVYSPLVEAWESLMTGVKKLNHKDEQLQEQLRPIEEDLINEIKQSAIGKQLQKQFDQS
jgi:chaperonin cofactor prefoldin